MTYTKEDLERAGRFIPYQLHETAKELLQQQIAQLIAAVRREERKQVARRLAEIYFDGCALHAVRLLLEALERGE